MFDENRKVWVPHTLDGFQLGRIVDIGAETVTVELCNDKDKGKVGTMSYLRSEVKLGEKGGGGNFKNVWYGCPMPLMASTGSHCRHWCRDCHCGTMQ